MAGILANSASRTMLAGETSADNSLSGWITGEQITLTTSPTGTDYQWSLSKPSGATVRSDLSAATGASVTFVPDVEGDWVIVCVVDSTTTYILTAAIVAIGTVQTVSVFRLLPLTDAQVPAPQTGRSLYYSSTQNSLAIKLPDNSVQTIDTTAVP